MSRSFALLAVVLLFLTSGLLPAAPSAPQAMPPHPRVWEKIQRGELALPRFLADPAWARAKGIETPRARPKGLTGTLNALAVAVKFSDNANTVTASFFDSLIFAAPVAGRGSVRDYFNEVSYGQVDIVTVNLPSSLGWRTAPQTYAYYVGYCGSNCGYCFDSPYPNNCQKLAEDIVDAVNSVVDFSQYDNDGDGYAEPIMLIHAGPGAEFTGNPHDIWSHSWSLMNPRTYDGVTIADYVIMPEYWMSVTPSTSDMTIGVFAHEMGHGFWNLPDLYDRDYSSSGIGDWSLMASGSWNGPNSGGWGTDGSSPAWPDAWSRVQMGFVAATNVPSNVSGKSIPQAYNNPAPAQTVLKLRSSALASQEYFLLENRQKVSGSYDEYLPGSGLLIWHVDEAMWNYSLQNDYECTLDPHCNCPDGQHYLVALEQADGARHLEFRTNQGDANDPFPGGTNNRTWTMATHPESSSWYACTNSCIGVTNISNSGATMTADLQVSCGAPPTSWIYLPLVFRGYNPMLVPVELTEGFEGGVVPPSGWSRVQNNPNETWKLMALGTPHTGLHAADVEYDPALVPQDEWLLSPLLPPMSSATLEFWSFGSLYWCRDTYDNCDLEVWIVVGSPGGGDDVYVGTADSDWTASWVWSHSTYDLTPYLPAVPARIAFRYIGQDGAQIALDDIHLSGAAVPLSPGQ